MSAQGDMRKLVRSLREQGAVVERGTDHWKVFSVDGALLTVLPTHGSREAGVATSKMRATLKRGGFVL